MNTYMRFTVLSELLHVARVIAIELKHYGIAAYNVVQKSRVVVPQITKIIYCRGVNNMEKKRVPQSYSKWIATGPAKIGLVGT